jgi:hypothetical protein
VSGAWYTRVANNAVNCGIGEFIDAKTFVITQDEADISVLSSSGDTFAGTVNGDIVDWTGSFEERGGTTTFTTLTITVAGNSASGNADWTWSDGTDSCNGTMAITASQHTADLEAAKNSVPTIADEIVFEDGVAFFTGIANGPNDEDWVSITADADASIQVELSHFDAGVNNYDLEVLDVDLNPIAASRSFDGFELVEVQVSNGDTIFIGVIPNGVEINTGYYLSVDIN